MVSNDMGRKLSSAAPGQAVPPSCDSVVGVRSCGCITAWMSLEHSTKEEVREFYADMADTEREVRRVNLDDVRGRICRCEHSGLGATPTTSRTLAAPSVADNETRGVS